MPLGKLLKKSYNSDRQQVILAQSCLVLKNGNLWNILDPENNNELVSMVSTQFLRNEILMGRLLIDAGWDRGIPDPYFEKQIDDYEMDWSSFDASDLAKFLDANPDHVEMRVEFEIEGLNNDQTNSNSQNND